MEYKEFKYIKEENSFLETVFSQENTFVGIRNTLEFDSDFSIPGIFISNVYDYSLSTKDQLISIPNWMDFKLIIDGEYINFDHIQINNFEKSLDYCSGMVTSLINFKLDSGHEFTLKKEDILSLSYSNVQISRFKLLSKTFSGSVCFESCVNYRYGNDYHGGFFGNNVKSHHWKLLNYDLKDRWTKYIYKTLNDSNFFGVKTIVETSVNSSSTKIRQYKRDGVAHSMYITPGVELCIVRKNIFYADGKYYAVKKEIEKINKLNKNFEYYKKNNTDILEKKYIELNFNINNSDKDMEGLLYSFYQLASISSPDKNNIPARGLTSQYHSGHFFFNNDIYLVPFYAFFYPEKAKQIIEYRISTLDQAKLNAENIGRKGAFWSEESGSTGIPSGPSVLHDFLNQKKMEEKTGESVMHITSDIIYSIKIYLDITGDNDIINQKCIELFIESCHFFESLLVYNSKLDVYEVPNVMGIDEYHLSVSNNYYTNEMLKWAFSFCVQFLEKLSSDKLTVSKSKLEKNIQIWKCKLNKMKVPFQKGNLFEQFDGYFNLKDETISDYAKNGLPEFSTNFRNRVNSFENIETQIIKQCDVLMFMSMFPAMFSQEEMIDNFIFYDKRTMHESSLSLTHAGIVSARAGLLETAYNYMEMSARFNLDFYPREEYRNGLHLAAYAGSWLILLYGFLGIQIENDILTINPKLCLKIKDLSLNFLFRNSIIKITINNNKIDIKIENYKDFSVNIILIDTLYTLTPRKNSVSVGF
ncbi:glycoside hydrolase family 65 protein [Carnobacterium mobile]|uniref:glycoside hydrolase family 65 protein n=1 Tax=Carnobacterium mobile TaxID=2750 RepID=UPI000554F7E6|nr:glycoside hydrolase family 65 protein [Carnobacterium mobile]